MQCPTCRNDTPGTLGKCSHCAAPIDVYSAGPVSPLSAPVVDSPVVDTPSAGAAELLGDRTVMVPPPTPSWVTDTPPPVTPDLAMSSPSQTAPEPPPMPAPPPAAAPPAYGEQPSVPGQPHMGGQPPGYGQPPPEQAYTYGRPGGEQPYFSDQPPAGTRPPLQLSAEPPAAPGPAPSSATPASPVPAFDPESTAAWTFDPDEDDDPSGGYGTPPAPSWGAAPPAGNGGRGVPDAFGMEPLPEPQESIVPESWYAQPRKPDVQNPGGTQGAPQWGQQHQTRMDAGPAQHAPAPGQAMPGQGAPGGYGAPMGMGGNFDQTRMDQGSPMAGPPPMGQGMPMGPMGPGGPGGPGGPAYGGYPPQQGGRPGGGLSKPLIAAAATLVTIAVGSVIFVVWPSGGDSSDDADAAPPTPSNTQVAQKNDPVAETKQQAAVVDKILDDSVKTRSVLAAAVGRAGKCDTLPQAIQGFEQVAQQRQDQLNRTKNLEVDRLARGERMRASLTEALTASLEVDQVLLRWAQQNNGCDDKPHPDAGKVPGRAAAERRATTGKQKLVVLWNPIAKQTGLPQRSWKRV